MEPSLGDQATAFSVLTWLLVSSSAPGWETICSHSGRQILAAGTCLQSLGSFQTKRHKAEPSLLPNMIALVFFSISVRTLFLLPSPWIFFSVRNSSHSERKKKKPIVSKRCLF